MTDAHGVARDQLRAFIERIERLEEEKKSIADDIKDVKAEAKGCGFDVGIINAVLKLRKIDANERAERDAMLDTYLIALGMLPEPTGDDEGYDRETGEVTIIDRDDADGNHIRVTVDPQIAAILGRQHAVPLRSDGGLSILTKHEDIRTAPVTAEEAEPEAAAEVAGNDLREPVAAEQGQIIREGDAPRETDRLGGDASHPDTDQPGTATELPDALEPTRGEHQAIASSEHGRSHGQAAGRTPESQTDGIETVTAGETATNLPETATEVRSASTDAPETPGKQCTSVVSKDEAGQNLTGTHSDQPLTGGDHEVSGIASRERDSPTSNTGEGAANTALPANGLKMEYCPPTGVRRSSFAHCFPEPSKDQRAALERDIIDNRVQVPIIRQGNVILDGWARYTIARSLGQSYPVKEYDGHDELLDVIEWQRASRNFTQAQEKKIAADLAKAMPDRADDIMAAFGLADALEAAE